MNSKRFIRWFALPMLALFAVLLCGCGDGYRSIVAASVQGEVRVSRAGQANDLACYEGMKLQDQDTVTTSDGGSLILKLDDDKYVYLEPGAQIQIRATGGANETKTEIQLLSGTMSAVIEKKLGADESFSVAVDNVSMVVRGTIFRVSLGLNEQGKPTVTVQTVEGKVGEENTQGGGAVEANHQDVILLTDDGGTILAAGEPIDYSELPPETLDWMRGALEDKLAAASDPDEISTLEGILDTIKVAGQEAAETPQPSITQTPSAKPPATPTPPPVYRLTIEKPSHGTIQAQGGSFAAGETVSLQAVPEEGYRFGGWLKNGASALGSSLTVTFTMPAEDVAIGATFIRNRYILSIEQPAQGGSISGTAGRYTPGSKVRLTAAADSGYVLTCWLVNGSVSSGLGKGTTVSYPMPDQDTEISAVFEEAHTLTLEQPTQGGTLNGTGGPYPLSAEVALSAVPDAGYTFSGWVINGSVSAELGTNPTLTFIMPGSDTTVSAAFTQTSHALSCEQPVQGGGSISLAAGQYEPGDVIALSVSPDANMTLACLLINGVADSSYAGQTSIDFVMPDGDTVVSAIFQSQ
ncbi:MAG: FecR domain-containing protein [Christensenella sp.]|nr:FecR domain-containing protein [Christensenella sp.]